MAGGGWTRSLALALLAWTTVGGSEVTDAPATNLSDLHRSLTALEGVLRGRTSCQDRVKDLWEGMAKRNATMGDSVNKILTLLDQLTPVVNSRKAHACGQNFTSAGDSCLHKFNSIKFEWWRSRFYCWMKGGEMIDPGDIKDLDGFLPKENGVYWIGASTSPELKFPRWTTVYGERLLSKQENFTSFPRDKPDHHCLAVNSDTLEIHTRNCNYKALSICQQRASGCLEPSQEVGEDCFTFHEESLSWENAQSKCKEENGNLAKVKDFEALQQFVEPHFDTKFWNVWIGGKRSNPTSALKWLDESVVNLTSHRHDEELSDGDCLALTPGSFQSRRISCTVELPFVCIK